MRSEFNGVEEDDEDREFNARFRDKDGNLLWDKIWEHVNSNPNRERRSFMEIHREMMERMRKQREDEDRRNENPSEDAA